MSNSIISKRNNLLHVIRDRNSVWKQFHDENNRKKGYGDGYMDGFHHATMIILTYFGREEILSPNYLGKEESNDL